MGKGTCSDFNVARVLKFGDGGREVWFGEVSADSERYSHNSIACETTKSDLFEQLLSMHITGFIMKKYGLPDFCDWCNFFLQPASIFVI